MASPIIDGLIAAWKKNQDYAQRLVADLSQDQMTAQPASDPAVVAVQRLVCQPKINCIVSSDRRSVEH